MRRLALLLIACLLVSPVFSQTVSPAPTKIGFPFFSVDGMTMKLTRGNDGAAWFAMQGRIGRINKNGTIRYFPLPGENNSPSAIAYGPDGNVWYGAYGTIGRLNRSSGAVTIYPILGQGNVKDMASAGGAIWFANDLRLGRISTAGVMSLYNSPIQASSLRAGPDNALWMIETFGRQIARVTYDGQTSNVWNISSSASACGPCASISAGPDGAMWFTISEGIPTVGRISMNGYVNYFQLPGKGAASISWIYDGALWFTDFPAKLIGRISTTGAVRYYAPNSNGFDSSVGWLAGGPDGDVWLGGNRSPNVGIAKVTLWGPYSTGLTASGGAHLGTPATCEVGWSDKEIVTTDNFQVYIHWGDGAVTKALARQTVKAPTNQFRASGNHTYAAAGSHSGYVTVYQPGNQYKIKVPFTINQQP